mgnify:CR=1 FL=1
MKIALLSTSYLESFYKKELKELDLADIIDVYVYYTYEHVVDLYRQIFIPIFPFPQNSGRRNRPDADHSERLPEAQTNAKH